MTIPNNLLQGEFSKAGVNTGRFIINTTVGILGLVDVADPADLISILDIGESPPPSSAQPPTSRRAAAAGHLR